MTDTDARYAIYFVPELQEPLWSFGSQVLGFNSYTSQPVEFFAKLSAAMPDWSACVAEPRRYGFHATLKAPFRLASGKTEWDLLEGVRILAAVLPVVSLGHLSVERLGRHVALRPAAHSAELAVLETAIVSSLDRFRAPLNEQELSRREPNRLTVRQREMLDDWGYPFCLDESRFHMTLAGPFPAETQEHIVSQLRDLYQVFDDPSRITKIAVVRQHSQAMPFQVHETFALEGEATSGVINRAFLLSHR